jgi:hypothetical protein
MWFSFDFGSANRKLDLILAQGVQIMGKVDTLTQLVSDMNDETNAIAARIDKLIEQGGEQIPDSLVSGFRAISDRLKSLGASQTDPIPAA